MGLIKDIKTKEETNQQICNSMHLKKDNKRQTYSPDFMAWHLFIQCIIISNQSSKRQEKDTFLTLFYFIYTPKRQKNKMKKEQKKRGFQSS